MILFLYAGDAPSSFDLNSPPQVSELPLAFVGDSSSILHIDEGALTNRSHQTTHSTYETDPSHFLQVLFDMSANIDLEEVNR